MVQIKEGGQKVTLGDQIDAIAASDPALAYLSDLKNNPNVNWQEIAEAHNSWHESGQGLTPAGAAIIAIAIMVATAGTGAAISASVSASATAAGASAAGATAAGAAASAAFTSLVTQASLSLINNQGNLGDVFGDLASSDTLKNLATATISAGLTAGIADVAGLGSVTDPNALNPTGVASLTQRLDYALIQSASGSVTDSVINGSDLTDGFTTRLAGGVAGAVGGWASGVSSAQMTGQQGGVLDTILQGSIGCAAGAAGGGDCGAGAIGGAVGGLAGTNGLSTDAARISAAIAALAAGADADSIYLAANTGEIHAGSTAYAIANTTTRPDLVLQLKDGYDQAGDSLINTVTGVLPSAENAGGIWTSVPDLIAGDRVHFIDEKAYGLSDLKANPSVLKGKTSVFWNGIMNSQSEALANAKQQLGKKYNDQTTVLAYNQTHGLIGDLIEVWYNRLSTYLPLLKTADMNTDVAYKDLVVGQNKEIKLYLTSHSAGGVFLNHVLKNTTEQQLSDSKIKIIGQYSGVPLNIHTLGSASKTKGIDTIYVQLTDGDFVPNILGYNAGTLPNAADSIVKLPSLFGDNSLHSDYPSAISGEIKAGTRLFKFENGKITPVQP